MNLTRRAFVQSGVAGIAGASLFGRSLFADEPQLSEEERKRREERSPETIARQLASIYGQQIKSVSYIPSMAVIGRLRLARLRDDQQAIDQCLELANKLTQLADSREVKPGPEGAGLILLAEAAPLLPAAERERSIAVLRRLADKAFNKNGKPLPAMPGHNEMSDGVFMCCPLLAATGQLTGESRYFEACENHFDFMRSLCEREDGLYRHSPLCEAPWGRGNGFPALGLTMSLDYLPKQHSAYEKFRKAADKLLTAVQKHADPMIHQVVDYRESYREFSGTAMCSIASLRLKKHRPQDQPKNEARARWVGDAWTELKRRISDNGELVAVCESTGKQKTLEDYLKRKAIMGRDDRGGAFALVLAVELMQSQ